MAVVTGMTAEKMLEIESASFVSARLEDNELILVTKGGEELNVGEITVSGGLTTEQVQALIDASIEAATAPDDGGGGGDPGPTPVSALVLFDNISKLDEFTTYESSNKTGMTVVGTYLLPNPQTYAANNLKHLTAHYVNGETQLHWRHGAPGTEIMRVVTKITADGTGLYALAQCGSQYEAEVSLFYKNNGVGVDLATMNLDNMPLLVTGQYCAMILRTVGNVVTLEFWDTEPGQPGNTPRGTSTVTLTGAAIPVVGAGVSGEVGFGVSHTDTQTLATGVLGLVAQPL